MSGDDWWRLLNAGIALIGAILIGKNLIGRWNVRKPRMRLMAMSLFAFLVVTIEGSIEQVIRGIPPGPRTVLTTMACAWVVIAFLITADDYTEDDPRAR